MAKKITNSIKTYSKTLLIPNGKSYRWFEHVLHPRELSEKSLTEYSKPFVPTEGRARSRVEPSRAAGGVQSHVGPSKGVAVDPQDLVLTQPLKIYKGVSNVHFVNPVGIPKRRSSDYASLTHSHFTHSHRKIKKIDFGAKKRLG